MLSTLNHGGILFKSHNYLYEAVRKTFSADFFYLVLKGQSFLNNAENDIKIDL